MSKGLFTGPGIDAGLGRRAGIPRKRTGVLIIPALYRLSPHVYALFTIL